MVEIDDTVVTIAKQYGKDGGGGGTLSGTDRVVEFTNVPAGTHKITLGIYNNQKTYHNERSYVTYDNVEISTEAPP